MPAVVYLCGQERLPIETALAEIEQQCLDPGLRDLNRIVLEAGRASGAEIVDSAATLPVGQKRRVVLVKMADALRAGDRARLLEYVESPSPRTCLVFWGVGLDRRTRFAKAVERAGCVAVSDALGDAERARWAAVEARRIGAALEPDAADLLVALAGDNLSSLRNEIEKLVAFSGTKRRIDTEAVGLAVSERRIGEVFDLIGEVARGDAEGALRTLARVLRGGEGTAFQLLGLLAWQARRIAEASELQAAGLRPRAIGTRMRLHPDAVEGLLSVAGRLGAPDTRTRIRLILDVDRRLKGSEGFTVDARTSRFALERLLLRLTRGSGL